MRRVFALCCLVACGNSASEPPKSADPPATAPSLAVSEPVAFGASAAHGDNLPPPKRLWHARHGAPITAVFATEDGGAAVSIDVLGNARLWPALDGTREPFALPLSQPKEVVLARDGDGFAIAARDTSGGLEVLAVDAAGRLTSHVRRPPEPGVAALASHDGGLLVLHRDQTLELLDLRGARRGVLLAAPGEHVVRLLARKGRTLALVRTKDGVRGHWLADDKLAWAEHTPKLRVDVNHVFLSPDHEHLITHRPMTVEIQLFGQPTPTVQRQLVNLGTGRVRDFAIDDAGRDSLGVPIGFGGDGKVVLAMDDFDHSVLEWWTLGGRKVAVIGEPPAYALELVSVETAAVTDASVIAFTFDELVIVTRAAPGAAPRARFLGYRTNRAKGLSGGPAGAVATVGASAIALDEELRATTRIPAPQAILLANDLALVQFVSPPRGPNQARTPTPTIDPDWLEGTPSRPRVQRAQPRLALYDLDQRKDRQRWPSARAFHFEPATQLLAIERPGKVELATFDPAERRFGAPRTFFVQGTQVALIDPALASGVLPAGALAIFVRVRGKTSEVRVISDLDGELPAPVTLAGAVEVIDRAGRLYMRESADAISIHHGDRPPVRLDGMAGWKLRPDPTGAQIAAFARNRLALFDAAGRALWSVGFPGISNVAWTADGELLVVAGDLAKIDVATGEVVAAQCGWGFALRAQRPVPVDFPSETETTCDR